MNGKKLTVIIKELSYDFIDCCAKANGISKSELMRRLLFQITLNYWSCPEDFNNAFKKVKKDD